MLPADKALLERLGARLRELREQAKLSQEAVGERAGFGGKYIGEIERGVRDVPLSTLRTVAESGLGVRIDTLFGDRAYRVIAVPRSEHARDVEMTASIVSRLPLRVRRPLLALIEAVSAPELATRAAERGAAKWRTSKRRKRSRPR